MAYLNWNDNLSVNVPVIDEQHQKLVSLINQLHDAMAQGHGSAVLGGIIRGLVDYTQIHFRDEERCFEASDYPDCATHMAQHEAFVSRVTDFQQGFAEGRLMLSLDVMDFLAEWLVEHIQGTDMSYAPFLAEESER